MKEQVQIIIVKKKKSRCRGSERGRERYSEQREVCEDEVVLLRGLGCGGGG